MKQQPLINFSLTTGRYQEFIDKITDLANRKISAIVCVANVHMFIEGYKNENFQQIVNNADIVTPDGKPLTLAMRLLYGIKQERVAGMDLLPDLLEQMTLQNLSAFFYGGSESVLKETSIYLTKKYPGLNISGLYSPPFRELNKDEEDEILKTINNAAPSVIFVVLGCPKQEKWMATMKGKINAVMIGVGGALPVMIGVQKRAPKWMQNYALEWLFRLFQEPGRLFKRYAITNSLFIWIMVKELLRKRLLIPLKLAKA